jgi:anti-sigma factor ChrR (cupin superfamily)
MNDEADRETVMDDRILVALARAAEKATAAPPAGARERLLDRLRKLSSPVPHGFSLRPAEEEGWILHPVPGIRMKVLSINRDAGYAMLLLDVPPQTRFPAHHHSGAEECYVLSGSLVTYGRRLGPGDFIHADRGTAHDELWTEEGCRVLLIAPPDEHGVPAP